MKAALISLGSKSSNWTVDAMRKYFDVVDDIYLKNIEVHLGIGKLDVLYNGQPLPKYDCIYAKGSFRYAPILRSVTKALSPPTYMPIKAATFTIGHDKLLTHLALQLYKTPMPTTYIASSSEGAKKILGKVSYPIVMKFPQGTQGKGVMFADSFASASSLLDALTALRQPFLIQEYIETGGVDIRAIVIGDEVIAMKRKAEKGEARANIHAGGKGEACSLDSHTKKIAIDAAQSIGADICAIDILEGPKEPLVIEANLSPGLQGITAATGLDVAGKIAKFLYKKTKEITESGKKLETTKILEDVSKKPDQKMIEGIITNLDFRGDRILLPKVVTNIAKFDDKKEVVIKAKKGQVVVEES